MLRVALGPPPPDAKLPCPAPSAPLPAGRHAPRPCRHPHAPPPAPLCLPPPLSFLNVCPHTFAFLVEGTFNPFLSDLGPCEISSFSTGRSELGQRKGLEPGEPSGQRGAVRGVGRLAGGGAHTSHELGPSVSGQGSQG